VQVEQGTPAREQARKAQTQVDCLRLPRVVEAVVVNHRTGVARRVVLAAVAQARTTGRLALPAKATRAATVQRTRLAVAVALAPLAEMPWQTYQTETAAQAPAYLVQPMRAVAAAELFWARPGRVDQVVAETERLAQITAQTVLPIPAAAAVVAVTLLEMAAVAVAAL
jgi:hypothetical protein